MVLSELAWRIVRIVYPILATVAVTGCCLNSILLVTTLRSKSLRSTANILIGCCALFDIIHQSGYLIQFPILFSDYYINSFACTCMIFIPELGIAAGSVSVLSIGIDRLLSILVLRPLPYMKYLYALGIVLMCSWCGYLMIAYWTPRTLICSMPSPYHDDAFGLWSMSLSIVNGMSVVVYFVMWQVVKRKGVSQHSKRILISIAVVTAFEVACWLIYSILINLSRIIVPDPADRPPYHYTSCLFVNFGILVKTIVYYSISTEYRRAIRATLGLKQSTASVSAGSYAAPARNSQTP